MNKRLDKMRENYEKVISILEQNNDKDFLSLLYDLRCDFISDIKSLESEQNIHKILDKKENLEIIKNALELAYEEKKANALSDEEVSNLTKKYHKDIDFVDDLHETLVMAKGIRKMNKEDMFDFTRTLDFAKKIAEHPHWYLNEDLDQIHIAIALRSYAEIHLKERIHDRSYDKEWDAIGVFFDDIKDKAKTKDAIALMYKSFGLDSNIKDLSNDYLNNTQKLINKLDSRRVSLQEVLHQVNLNLLIDESNLEPLTCLLESKYGKDIVSFVNLHMDVNTSRKIEDMYNYIHYNEISESLKVSSTIDNFSNLLEVKDKMYHEWFNKEHEDALPILIESKVFDISNLLKEENVVNDNSFEKEFNWRGPMFKSNEEIYTLRGAYFDTKDDTIKIAIEFYFSDRGKSPIIYSIPKEEFLETSKKIIETAFEDVETKERTSSMNSDLNKSILKQLEKKELEF